MPSGAGLLPPILFESAHKMDANQPAPLTPIAPFSGRNISSSYATFAPAATLSATPPPAPTPSPVPATEPTTAAHPAPTPAPVTTSDAQPGADAVAQFLASFNPTQMASVAASAAASAATAALRAAPPATTDRDKDKSKDSDETPVRPWTEGDYPVFDVDGLHPDELRLAALPWKRREELGATVTKAVHQQLYESADPFTRDAQDPQLLDPLISQMIMVSGGDTAMGNVIRTVRPANGLTADSRASMKRELERVRANIRRSNVADGIPFPVPPSMSARQRQQIHSVKGANKQTTLCIRS